MARIQRLLLPILVIVAAWCMYVISQAMYVTPVNPRLLEKEESFRAKYGQYYGISVEEVLFRLHEPLETSLEQ